MGLGIFYVVADNERQARSYCKAWNDAIESLEVHRSLEEKVILSGEADCSLQLKCDVCGNFRCIGCRQTVSINITEGHESAVCLGCWESPGHPLRKEESNA